ncbi:MAG: Gfo/Idh/MocA family oxidoreductase [Phycisphaeraceae bacterium]
MVDKTTRRTFLGYAGAAGMTLPLVMPKLTRAESANEKINFAFVATGGRAGAHVGAMSQMGHNSPCFAEVLESNQSNAAEAWPSAQRYSDYRRMFDKHHNEFDAVFVATPDHTHFHAAASALELGKHVYCEKPLTWSVWEARRLTELAQKNKVQTQMGNQGHADEGWRVLIELVRAGAIGNLKEAHTWTNRPVWPQGMHRPKQIDPVPAGLDWNTWIGPAPLRHYTKDTYPFAWRGWRDFGAGALGDMACHTMDGLFWAFDPGHPISVEPLMTEGLTGDAFPTGSTVKWEFAAKGDRPAFTSYWYDGKKADGSANLPPRPDELDEDLRMPQSGNLFIGDKGTILVSGDYGGGPRLIPEAKRREFGRPPQLLERSPGHHQEFVNAIKGGPKPGSNFDYAGPMTETILLGNVALLSGRKLEWDGPNMKVTNFDQANQFIRRQPRQGWEEI